jgi:hypothetical protein
MRKAYGWLTLAMLAVCCLILFQPAQARLMQPEAVRLLKAMEDSGAKGLDVEVRTRLPIGQVNSTKELESLAVKWAERLNIPAEHADISKEKEQYVYRILSNHDDIRLHFQVSGLPLKGAYQAYLVIHLKGSRHTLPYIVSMQDTVAAALKQAGLIPQFSTCIRGMYSDKMSVDQQEGKILSIFRALQAKELERLQDDSVISISGYTRAWESFILSSGQKLNLQVATHRDTESDGTWITVGTPIITAEY